MSEHVFDHTLMPIPGETVVLGRTMAERGVMTLTKGYDALVSYLSDPVNVALIQEYEYCNGLREHGLALRESILAIFDEYQADYEKRMLIASIKILEAFTHPFWHADGAATAQSMNICSILAYGIVQCLTKK